MFKNLLKKSRPIKLGRWGVTYEPSVLEKRINWANHDHCGSEVCENNFIIENQIKVNKTNKINKTNKNQTIDSNDFEPLIPYCM